MLENIYKQSGQGNVEDFRLAEQDGTVNLESSMAEQIIVQDLKKSKGSSKMDKILTNKDD